MPYSLPWLFTRMKKPELFVFQNNKITSSTFVNLKKSRIDRYRSFWGTSSVAEQNGGVCTFSRKSVPVALDVTVLEPKKHFYCSHNYNHVVPFSGHQIFNIYGENIVVFVLYVYCN